MFSFSLCLGRKQKSIPRQPDLFDQKISTFQPIDPPPSNSGHSCSTKITSEIESNKLHDYECAIPSTNPASLKSPVKKPYSSSIVSRSSASLTHFRPSSGFAEPLQSLNDCRLSLDLGWPIPHVKSSMSSGPPNLHMKFTDFGLDRPLTTHKENDELPPARPLSYSDDPFAPPTPRMTTFSPSFSHMSGVLSDTTRGSILTTQPRRIDLNETHVDPPILIPVPEPQLPTITRVSKLSIDWILQLQNSSILPNPRLHMPSMTSGTTPSSPNIVKRTSQGTNATNTPRTSHSKTCFSSKSGDSNQVPFPEYP